jgi:hypothetical protein
MREQNYDNIQKIRFKKKHKANRKKKKRKANTKSLLQRSIKKKTTNM